MTVFNLGSINVDHFYRVPHLPVPGETLAATGYDFGLGGKGANQSVAAARMGSTVVHIGMVGPDGAGRDLLADYGVDVRFVGTDGSVTGNACIYVDVEGENLIVVLPGANHEQSLSMVEAALTEARSGDHFMLQNEVTLGAEAARIAKNAGCFVTYSAAPFKPEKVAEMLPLADLIVMNEVEAQQLSKHLEMMIEELPVPNILVTRGSAGVTWRGDEVIFQPAFPVHPVDTTGAGDCFIGAVIAGLDQGFTIPDALRLGAAASAIQVTRPGTAQAIPTRAETDTLLSRD
ncbi:ribokinase [Maritimibacter sp. UBA3975]|uniref:ribokinase n=1 Tax=Maritimibacter sp. UBA3975 TaxID=1946833 RepID=UPI000C0A5565|nr:ribokinase [Maritimibacter sp. UBA3975]MAM63426.1 ribokinase [Maritimibacter sp.]|tara:strand:+ start:53674 stop:54540 length:867 start_codon:yes stop_codon:yes gene_type:complete